MITWEQCNRNVTCPVSTFPGVSVPLHRHPQLFAVAAFRCRDIRSAVEYIGVQGCSPGAAQEAARHGNLEAPATQGKLCLFSTPLHVCTSPASDLGGHRSISESGTLCLNLASHCSRATAAHVAVRLGLT